MSDAFACPTEELGGLFGREGLLHLEEMADRHLLQLALGFVNVSEGGVDRRPVHRRLFEGRGEFMTCRLDAPEEGSPLLGITLLDRGELLLLLRGDPELGVKPFVEGVSGCVTRMVVDVVVVMMRRLPRHDIGRDTGEDHGGRGPEKRLLRGVHSDKRGLVAPLNRVNCGGAGRAGSLLTLDPMRKASPIAAAQEIAPEMRTRRT